MRNSNQAFIAGSKTPDDWRAFRAVLLGSTDAASWEEAYRDYYLERLKLRYLNPIDLLRENSTYQGEGFSIVAIQCTLIEFLESTVRGLKYRYLRRGEVLGPYEYSSSKDLFIAFLSGRIPFSLQFTVELSADFYASVRCGLLHEACTKNGWKIWGRCLDRRIVDPANKIVFRDNLQEAVLSFIRAYKDKLIAEPECQAAFIRKFDSLCE